MKQFMKRLVFALAVTLSVLGMKQSVFAENIIYVNETTFPDEILRYTVIDVWSYMMDLNDEYFESYDYDDENGVKIDADLITYIYIEPFEDYPKISSLKGIELLTNLKSLMIPGYYGGKFDLSSNTELREVDIESKKYALSPNDFACLKKLTDLEVSGKAISDFDCSDLNNLKNLNIRSDIKKLDVSKCKKLSFLTVKADSLESVNLGGASALKKINIEGAKRLSSIDVSKNKKLQRLYLNENKNLKSIKLKNNNMLYDVEIYSTSISKLDTSNMKNLRRLWAEKSKLSSLNLRNNTKLEELNVENTPLKKLDVTKNKKLKYIDIDRSKIKSINLKNQKELRGLTYSYGQKITYPSKITRNGCWISIEGVKKGSSIAVPAFCKGYKFSADKEYSLKYKNNKIITSKKTKKKYAYGNFTKGDKTISISIKYK